MKVTFPTQSSITALVYLETMSQLTSYITQPMSQRWGRSAATVVIQCQSLDSPSFCQTSLHAIFHHNNECLRNILICGCWPLVPNGWVLFIQLSIHTNRPAIIVILYFRINHSNGSKFVTTGLLFICYSIFYIQTRFFWIVQIITVKYSLTGI